MSIEIITLFFSTSIALALVPGPDNIFVLTQAALHGRKAGLFVTLGLCTGLLVYTAIVALGVAAIFQTSTIAFNMLKVVGALYLLYLAWLAFQASNVTLSEATDVNINWHKLYSRGVLMNLTNPKVAIFFLAFLPQFADPSRGSITIQLLIFGGLFIIATLFIFGSIAWSAGFLGEWLKRSTKAQTIMNRTAGMIFLGLALRLIMGES